MSKMDIKSYIGNPRITDYSFRLDKYIRTTLNLNKNDLINLYNYHKNLCIPPNALYPESNWQSHRLCLMSSIAVYLNDTIKVTEVERLAIEWITVSDCKCCDAKSRDYHYRDSCIYIVYGWWAIAQCFVNLQSKTKRPYKKHFINYFNWLKPYQTGVKKHIEFLKSKNMPQDLQKAEYNKLFDPNYNINLLRVYNLLSS